MEIMFPSQNQESQDFSVEQNFAVQENFKRTVCYVTLSLDSTRSIRRSANFAQCYIYWNSVISCFQPEANVQKQILTSNRYLWASRDELINTENCAHMNGEIFTEFIHKTKAVLYSKSIKYFLSEGDAGNVVISSETMYSLWDIFSMSQ